MKGVGRPGGGVGGLVMDVVGIAEDAFMVQQAVHPIEIRVMDDEAEHQADGDPPIRIIGRVLVDEGVVAEGCGQHEHCFYRKDQAG